MRFKFSFTAPLQFFIQNLAMFFTSFYKVCRLTSKFPPMHDYCSFNVYLFKVCACKWLKSYILKIGLTSCLPSDLPVSNYLFPWQSHISVLETTQENQAILLMGLEYLIGISYVEDTEVFKVCLDYWNSLVCDLFQSECNMEAAPALAPLGLQVNSCFKVFCPTFWPLWLMTTTTSLLCCFG
jgi:hypothetical protein